MMKTFESLSDADKAIVHAMSDAARDAMRDGGTDPTNDDRVAIFDEACAVYLVDSRKGYPGRPLAPVRNAGERALDAMFADYKRGD